MVQPAEVPVLDVPDLRRQVCELPFDPVHLRHELVDPRNEPGRVEAQLLVQPARSANLHLMGVERLPSCFQLPGHAVGPPLLPSGLGQPQGVLQVLLGLQQGVLRRGCLGDRPLLALRQGRGVGHTTIVGPRGASRPLRRGSAGSFQPPPYDRHMRVLVLGASGQLGSDIVRLWSGQVEVIPAVRSDADVTDAEAVRRLVASARPDVVVNTTAFHNLPVCEQEPLRTFEVNAVGGRNVALAAREAGAALVQFSTDYVFDGSKRAPYVESDARRALNVYGTSKIATEDLVLQAHPGALVVRVSGLFGLAGSAGKGGNFVETMLRLAREGQPIRVVADQVTAPTNTAEIAEGLLPLVESGMTGVVHLAAAEGCSWADFAEAIFQLCGLRPDFRRVTSEEFGGPVVRPKYSVLGSERVAPLRHWRLGLERYLREKGHIPA
jgi:dTDP-4-dehydrorhamnose reductase